MANLPRMFRASNTIPTVIPTAGYVPIEAQAFGSMTPNFEGKPTGIPINTNGYTGQSVFSKINTALTLGKPLPKIVINTQQSRF